VEDGEWDNCSLRRELFLHVHLFAFDWVKGLQILTESSDKVASRVTKNFRVLLKERIDTFVWMVSAFLLGDPGNKHPFSIHFPSIQNQEFLIFPGVTFCYDNL